MRRSNVEYGWITERSHRGRLTPVSGSVSRHIYELSESNSAGVDDIPK